MAEKPEIKKSSPSGGEMSFGLEIILFMVALFVIWVLMGGSNKKVDKPFITPLNDQVNPGMPYGPGDIKN